MKEKKKVWYWYINRAQLNRVENSKKEIRKYGTLVYNKGDISNNFRKDGVFKWYCNNGRHLGKDILHP